MVLAIDIGNSNIVIGGYQQKELQFDFRLCTDTNKTEFEYSYSIKNILDISGINIQDIKGCIISSVVPQISYIVKDAIKIIHDIKIIMVEPGIKTGVNIKIDNPAQLGSDLLCTAVGVISRYSLPAIVVDLGTATKFTAIDSNKNLLGGSIIPGVSVSLDALISKTAQLPYISLEAKGDITTIGTNTIDCMRSGVVLGTACTIDGMVKKYKKVLGDNVTVIGCGGLVSSILPYCEEKLIYDKNLILNGLIDLYYKNI
ncbi:MAG: type III pantothenate kinase [Oscillospiraceae bacterium]